MKTKYKQFFITTPIYYPSGNPHIGHAYTTIIADTLAKYKKLIGYEVFMLTGMDEHGQKIENKAKELKLKPQKLVDKYAKVFLNLWKLLGINYSKFIRTTSSYHKITVQKVFDTLLKQNFIYLDKWEGLYCVSCEENYTKTLAIFNHDDKQLYCKQNHLLVSKSEPSYFLKIKQFKKWIISFLKTTDLVYPPKRINELLNSFIYHEEFNDLSISRTTFDWGIKVKSNKKHVIYVWLDALLNYLTALGYMQKDDANFKMYWLNNKCQIVHLMSKEITRFHCIYWPIILEMLQLRKPTNYISHGWIITNQGKMSKSIGNVLDPIYFVKKYGVDIFRYYLAKEISFKEDSVFSEANLINVFNSDLANNIGNLFNRTIGLLKKYNNGIVPKYVVNKNTNIISFSKKIKAFDLAIIEAIESLNIQNIITKILELINHANIFIETLKPWTLAKNKETKILLSFLNLLVNVVKRVIYFLQPVLINGTKIAAKQFKINLKTIDLNFVTKFNSMDNYKVSLAIPIYLRINENKKQQ